MAESSSLVQLFNYSAVFNDTFPRRLNSRCAVKALQMTGEVYYGSSVLQYYCRISSILHHLTSQVETANSLIVKAPHSYRYFRTNVNNVRECQESGECKAKVKPALVSDTASIKSPNLSKSQGNKERYFHTLPSKHAISLERECSLKSL